jgi:Zn-finger nucleic acid-binding protein
MNCPACDNVMTLAQVGGVAIDVCQHGCGGIWLDAFELRKLQAELAHHELPLIIRREAGLSVDFTRRRHCPRCQDQVMMRRYSSRKRTVEIDECPQCGGHWLDYGELERILAETKMATPSPLTLQQVKSFLGGLRREGP